MGSNRKMVIAIIASILICIMGVFLLVSPWISFAVGLWRIYPEPPKPKIKYGEFDFTFVYEMDGEIRSIEDTIICEFDGFQIDEGRGKTRRWKEDFENKQNNELYAWRVEQMHNPDFNEYKGGRKPDYDQIVLKNIDHLKCF